MDGWLLECVADDLCDRLNLACCPGRVFVNENCSYSCMPVCGCEAWKWKGPVAVPRSALSYNSPRGVDHASAAGIQFKQASEGHKIAFECFPQRIWTGFRPSPE